LETAFVIKRETTLFVAMMEVTETLLMTQILKIQNLRIQNPKIHNLRIQNQKIRLMKM